MAGGGKGANQAVAAARAGAKVHFVGCVGTDVFGRESLERLKAEGIDTTHIAQDAGQHSGLAIIMVGPDGDNIISVAPCANSAVTPQDVDDATDVIEAADVMIVQMEIPSNTVYHAISMAHACKTRVVLNPAPAPSEPVPNHVLAMIDFLVPNEVEAMRLAGAADFDACIQSLLERGVTHVIVTLGAKGAAVFNSTGRRDVPSFPMDAVDAVGAGDAFCGVLAVGIAEGLNLPEAMRMANAAAALSVTGQGAQPSMPLREEIVALMT